MDIWQVLGTPQLAEITAVVSIIVSVSLAQKPSPSKKKKTYGGNLSRSNDVSIRASKSERGRGLFAHLPAGWRCYDGLHSHR